MLHKSLPGAFALSDAVGSDIKNPSCCQIGQARILEGQSSISAGRPRRPVRTNETFRPCYRSTFSPLHHAEFTPVLFEQGLPNGAFVDIDRFMSLFYFPGIEILDVFDLCYRGTIF